MNRNVLYFYFFALKQPKFIFLQFWRLEADILTAPLSLVILKTVTRGQYVQTLLQFLFQSEPHTSQGFFHTTAQILPHCK